MRVIEKAHVAVKKGLNNFSEYKKSLKISSMKRIENIIPKQVAKTINVNLKNVSWMIDPIQSYTLELKKQKIPVFAEALSRNLTGLYFKFLDYKVEMKENVSIEFKGTTRSGKSTGAISSAKYTSNKAGLKFPVHNICPNEQVYVQLIPNAKFQEQYIIDEQLEQHTGLGCLTAGHKIFTDIGWINIEDLEKQPERKILSMNGEAMEWIAEFTFMKYKTKLPLYEITIEGGGRLTVTQEHKFPIFNNPNCSIITAENLKVGDYIRIVRKVIPLKNMSFNVDFAELIGLLISEGSLSKIRHKEDAKGYRPIDYYRKNEFFHHAVKFYNKDEKKISEFKGLFKKLFPDCILHQFKRERDIMLITNNKKVFEECSKYVPVGKKSSIVKVPKEIFRANHEAKRRFIRGLYLGDGSIYFNKLRRGRGLHITYYSKSECLCRDLKLLLTEFGINSQIRKQFNPKGFKPFIIWTTRISSKNNFELFMKIFMNKSVILPFKPKSNFKFLNLRRIKSIKKIKHISKYVYDIEVPKNHNFIVEGILSKNSFREMQHTEDLNNIIAKLCIGTYWIHPPEFVGRNSFYGLETCGRNFEYKLTKFLLYDLTQKTFGASSIPLGYVIIPKYDDPKFEKEYEAKKDIHINDLRNENISTRQQARLDEGFALAKNKLFQKLKNNHQKIQVARRMFPMRTEGEYMELISIANMNLKLGINQKEFDEAKLQVDKDLEDIKKAKR